MYSQDQKTINNFIAIEIKYRAMYSEDRLTCIKDAIDKIKYRLNEKNWDIDPIEIANFFMFYYGNEFHLNPKPSLSNEMSLLKNEHMYALMNHRLYNSEVFGTLNEAYTYFREEIYSKNEEIFRKLHNLSSRFEVCAANLPSRLENLTFDCDVHYIEKSNKLILLVPTPESFDLHPSLSIVPRNDIDTYLSQEKHDEKKNLPMRGDCTYAFYVRVRDEHYNHDEVIHAISSFLKKTSVALGLAPNSDCKMILSEINKGTSSKQDYVSQVMSILMWDYINIHKHIENEAFKLICEKYNYKKHKKECKNSKNDNKTCSNCDNKKNCYDSVMRAYKIMKEKIEETRDSHNPL